MNYLDVYYRALRDYRQNTLQNRECESQRGAVVKANAKDDIVTVTRKICHVETDWIEAIEQGLEHVDKAIREDRQFIRSNGEVVDIEKVKNVSKDSVKHLAEHSNLITRYEEGKDIVPDRLYIVERLNDYAVYENRFLYMMLCYLRDFITIRYNKILELEHTYNADMEMTKTVEMPKRRLSLDIHLQESKQDDPYLADRSGSKEVIARIRNILELVHLFLATPLMEEVSKVAMIKPPITKTNVLRMNQNFRGALALYEYVAAYDKDGYTVTEDVQKIQPFRMDMADEFSEIVLLSSFLTYEYGMNVRSDLQARWEDEEERRRKAKQQRLQEQIKSLRRRIQEEGISPEEYMVLLERRNRALEADSERLVSVLQHVEQLETTIKELKAELKQRNIAIEQLNATIDRLHTDYKRQIEKLHEDYKAQISDLHSDYKEQIRNLHNTYTQQINEQNAAHEAERTSLQNAIREGEERHSAEMLALESAHRLATEQLVQAHTQRVTELRNECELKIDQMQAVCREKDEQMAKTFEENQALIAARRLADARLRALRAEKGMPETAEGPTTKEEFEELEYQFEVFKSLFEKEWKKTKKHIRKSVFSSYRQAIKEGRDKEFIESITPEEKKNAKKEAPDASKDAINEANASEASASDATPTAPGKENED